MKTEIMILGGGLAGAAAAITLARAGREVMLMERERAPVHKVCGEFLSAEALGSLAELGLDVVRLGAVPITQVHVCRKGRAATATLPFAARSLTRRTLDEAMLEAAERAGARVLRGENAEQCTAENAGWTSTFGHGRLVVSSATAMIATGKHDVRGRRRPAGVQSDLVAFKMYWKLAPEQARGLNSTVELMLFRGGYAGLQPVEDGAVNLCCVVRRARLQELGGTWERLLAAMQGECGALQLRLEGAVPLLLKPLAVSAIPYGYVRRETEGVWVLGDQAVVIPSFTGDGMSIALYSGMLAARMFLEGRTPEAYQQRLHDAVRAQVRFATWLSRGLVSPLGQRAAMAGLHVWPGALPLIARRTRLREAAM